MILAFLYPMIGGTLPCFVISRLRRLPKPWTLYAWRAGVMTAMIGSLMRGALEIYGTSNRLTAAYSMLCGALCLAVLVIPVVEAVKFFQRRRRRQN